MRSQPHCVDFFAALIADPGIDQILREHPTLQEEVVILFQIIQRLIQAQPQRDFLGRSTEFGGRRLRALFRYQRKRLRNAKARPEPGRDQPDGRCGNWSAHWRRVIRKP